MSNEHNFKQGDKVYHKIDGHPMIVEEVNGDNITCSSGTNFIDPKKVFKATSLSSSSPFPSGQKVPETW